MKQKYIILSLIMCIMASVGQSCYAREVIKGPPSAKDIREKAIQDAQAVLKNSIERSRKQREIDISNYHNERNHAFAEIEKNVRKEDLQAWITRLDAIERNETAILASLTKNKAIERYEQASHRIMEIFKEKEASAWKTYNLAELEAKKFSNVTQADTWKTYTASTESAHSVLLLAKLPQSELCKSRVSVETTAAYTRSQKVNFLSQAYEARERDARKHKESNELAAWKIYSDQLLIAKNKAYREDKTSWRAWLDALDKKEFDQATMLEKTPALKAYLETKANLHAKLVEKGRTIITQYQKEMELIRVTYEKEKSNATLKYEEEVKLANQKPC